MIKWIKSGMLISALLGLFAAGWLLSNPVAAGAHNSNDTSTGWLYRSSGNCVWGSNQFNHGVQQVVVGSYKEYKLFGVDQWDCYDSWERPARNIKGKGEWYRTYNGQSCSTASTIYNSSPSTAIQIDYFRHLDHWCNKTNVAMVGRHYVSNGSWYGGYINPAGSHNYGV